MKIREVTIAIDSQGCNVGYCVNKDDVTKITENENIGIVQVYKGDWLYCTIYHWIQLIYTKEESNG